MKYAITSSGKSSDACIDRCFGRCTYVVTFDTDTKALEFFPNPFKNEDEGVGPLLLGMLDEKGVKKVISGSFGIKIKDLMDSKQMQMIILNDEEMTVASVIDLIEKR